MHYPNTLGSPLSCLYGLDLSSLSFFTWGWTLINYSTGYWVCENQRVWHKPFSACHGDIRYILLCSFHSFNKTFVLFPLERYITKSLYKTTEEDVFVSLRRLRWSVQDACYYSHSAYLASILWNYLRMKLRHEKTSSVFKLKLSPSFPPSIWLTFV